MLLLEDVRTAQARLRQEKLAAMGRVSAGIAHEIRNPLSTIAQANALLLEDALPEPQQRLLRMVADNVERLKRLVDEVMEVAPGTAPRTTSRFFSGFCISSFLVKMRHCLTRYSFTRLESCTVTGAVVFVAVEVAGFAVVPEGLAVPAGDASFAGAAAARPESQ